MPSVSPMHRRYTLLSYHWGPQALSPEERLLFMLQREGDACSLGLLWMFSSFAAISEPPSVYSLPNYWEYRMVRIPLETGSHQELGWQFWLLGVLLVEWLLVPSGEHHELRASTTLPGSTGGEQALAFDLSWAGDWLCYPPLLHQLKKHKKWQLHMITGKSHVLGTDLLVVSVTVFIILWYLFMGRSNLYISSSFLTAPPTPLPLPVFC